MKMTMNEVAKAVHSATELGEWGSRIVTSVSFDTRQLQIGGLFVPLIAQRDGHDFVESAVAKGAVGSFWQSDHEHRPYNFPTIEVKDIQQALIDLAKYYLYKVNPRVIAVTGSNGKTTTKDMIAAVLSTQSNTHKTVANYNNEIGVPYTILGMDTNTENLVLEMGMDRPGQLHTMSMIAEPDIAVITMIGEAHIEFFGTRDKIADAKLEITDGLKEDGVLIYNGDEPLLTAKVPENMETKTFGLQAANALVATDVVAEKEKTYFKTNLWPEKQFELPLMGDYNVNNALAAILVGQQVHVPVNEIITALKQFQITSKRTEWLKASNGCDILSDVYNSNPTAVKKVLKNFSAISNTGRKKVVLGDMLELGAQSRDLHAGVADALDPEIITEVYLYGKDIQALYDVLQHKYDAAHLHYYCLADKALMVTDIKANLHPNDAILLKASHGLHLETVVADLQA
ncbi:UDP-N-acetylmuramoyl-tripeptide--D-alanyl-D-alanine ligase [Agrilactobacillus yilanensis]|uniref:UDP-N-acetylmuramoyl-tripeptide--D-alanyl-D-alanine ligase n=1 Tax=Agrilactobacillus yilanensis TaxID=2485997 RepID=A0ABW4J4L0_9LACO|nr:UDP-N-acetylmuramoyl-tripeptide--D-alanyl-D-alanine ligase [Agrilactobacillus yilanensis]